MYCIHGKVDGHNIPLVYCLLPNKTYKTYKRLLELIKGKLVGVPWKATAFMIDFEVAMVKAITEVFPNTAVIFCLFHLGHSVNRQVNEEDLKYLYQNDDNIRILVRSLMSLSLVPPDEVAEIFDSLYEEEWGEADVIYKYFEANYIGNLRLVGRGRNQRQVRDTPRFPIKKWNHFERVKVDLCRTNNAVEGFHHAFRSQFTYAHPTMWQLLAQFKEEEKIMRTRLADIETGTFVRAQKAVYKRVNQSLKTLCENYETYGDKKEYLRKISYQLASYQ
jgi:hypothetical protein